VPLASAGRRASLGTHTGYINRQRRTERGGEMIGMSADRARTLRGDSSGKRRLRSERRAVPRTALTRTEAAESLGVGLTTFKQQIQPELRLVRRGRLLPHRAAHQGVDELRPGVDRGLRRAQRRPARVLRGHEREQGGDPAKLDQALLTIAVQEQPPFRFIAGADAIAVAEEKLA
jgi:hypothetical protein